MKPRPATWEPHRLVFTGRRWYLLAWDTQRADWRTFRADRITPRVPTGPRFTPRQPTTPDVATHVLRGVTSRAWTYPARLRLHAPAAVIADRITPTGGVLTALDSQTCLLETGGHSPFDLAGYLASLDVPFDVLAPAATSPNGLIRSPSPVTDRCTGRATTAHGAVKLDYRFVGSGPSPLEGPQGRRA